MLIRVKKGLDIPIGGTPQQEIEEATQTSRAAFLASEYQGFKPSLKVATGQYVARGQELFVHKVWSQIRFLSPLAGTVSNINRGDYRLLQSIEITPAGNQSEKFPVWDEMMLRCASRDELAAHLQQGGLWPALKTRPYGKIPAPHSKPESIFVTAVDTRPLAADPQVIIADRSEHFATGLKVLTGLTDGNVYLCVAQQSSVRSIEHPQVQRVEFAGPHPAGLPGTHIHFLAPVYGDKMVWSINYQDVIAIGELFLIGEYPVSRVIALAGPACYRPRLLKVRLGDSIDELCRDEIEQANVRVISGSVLDGVRVDDRSSLAYIGRFQLQISALPDRGQNQILAWIRPGLDLFSVTRVFFPKWLRRRDFSFSCMQNGSERALLPLSIYERVFPLEMLPTPLLRALLVMDAEQAQALGCLELEEEDLSLCSYICPGKHEFGPMLRKVLNQIEKEG